jgi:4-hydroxybenzoate polyprenyltransferase
MEAQLRHCPDPRISVPAAAIAERVQPNRAGSLGGWLELVRPPNLFTVPGDILAGAALAGLAADKAFLLLPAVLASLLLYTSGLILNDYMDRHTDARERPSRPIPSGRVSPTSACAASLTLMGTAVVLTLLTGVTQFWVTAVILSGLVVLYNGPARRIPAVGFTVMGLCRGGNVLLGASIVDGLTSPAALTGAGMETLYIVCVTLLAHGEVDKPPARWQWWLPVAVVAGAGPIIFFSLHAVQLATIIPLVLVLAWLSVIVTNSGAFAGQTPQKIGVLIRGLILLQILLVTFAQWQNPMWFNRAAVGALILMFIAAEWMAMRFHGS